MLKGKRRKTMSSFGPDGKRIGGSSNFGSGLGRGPSMKRPLGARGLGRPSIGSSKSCGDGSNSGSRVVPSFGRKRGLINIQRAPIMAGLNVMVGSAGLLKPFQRPKLGRRAYKGKEDELLRKSSLGARRSTGGMQRLLSRAGKGLHYLGKRRIRDEGGSTDESSDEEENKEEDRPFEPLMVWTSPFQGGEAKGLPSSM